VKPLYDRRRDEVCLDEVERNAIKGHPNFSEILEGKRITWISPKRSLAKLCLLGIRAERPGESYRLLRVLGRMRRQGLGPVERYRHNARLPEIDRAMP
jgi:hypothetical protein